jgi:hypothetical protein
LYGAYTTEVIRYFKVSRSCPVGLAFSFIPL